ncbi:hypothetical protein LCGC14_2407640, partial [marine sediment metagenome]
MKYMRNFQTKTTRFIKKKENILSKILYILSLGKFLIDTIILSLGSTYNFSLSIGAWIYLLTFGSVIILVPICYYIYINKNLDSSQLKSFEMLGTLIVFIADIFVNYIPDFTFFSIYPGSYIIGVFTASIFILISILFVPKAAT